MARHLGADGAGGQVGVDARRCRPPGRRSSRTPLTAAADDDGGWGRWCGLGVPTRLGDAVVLPGQVASPVRPQRLHDGQALCHPVDPGPGGIVGDARLLVVGGHPARPQAELDAPFREQVEGGHLLGQDHRMAVVVAEDQRAHPQGGGGLGGHGQGHQRPELVVEVVGDEQGGVARGPRSCGRCRARPAPTRPSTAGRRSEMAACARA